jgi:hypothetical protein
MSPGIEPSATYYIKLSRHGGCTNATSKFGSGQGPGKARALRHAVADASRTIVRMPAHFTTYAEWATYLPARAAPGPRVTDRVIVDGDWLWRFGEWEVPPHLWDGLRHLQRLDRPGDRGEWSGRGSCRRMNAASWCHLLRTIFGRIAAESLNVAQMLASPAGVEPALPP